MDSSVSFVKIYISHTTSTYPESGTRGFSRDDREKKKKKTKKDLGKRYKEIRRDNYSMYDDRGF